MNANNILLSYEEIRAKDGRQRESACIPPFDAWELVREMGEVSEMWDEFPKEGEDAAFAWEPYKAVYGLGGTPKLWHLALKNLLQELGFVESVIDETMMYLRTDSQGNYGAKEGPLVCVVTIRVNNIGVSGVASVQGLLHSELEKGYVTVKRQSRVFSHVGSHYEQLGDFSMTSDLEHFTSTLQPETLPTGRWDAPFSVPGMTLLKSANGCLSFGTGNRMKMRGQVTVSQQNATEGAVEQDLKFVNSLIKEMAEPEHGQHKLRDPALKGKDANFGGGV